MRFLLRMETVFNRREQAYYRAGKALLRLHRFGEALSFLKMGYERAPENQEMKCLLRKSEEGFEAHRSKLSAQQLATRKEIAATLRKRRHEQRREQIVNSWRQSLASPDWDPEDYDWRPTYLPALKNDRLSRQQVIKDKQVESFIAFGQALFDISLPRHALWYAKEPLFSFSFGRFDEGVALSMLLR